MTSRRPTWHPVAALTAIAVYFVAFYGVRMPSLEQVTGQTFRRGEFFLYLLMPEELLRGWFGTPPEFSVLDRLPVLALAGSILAVAVAAGWLLLRLLGVDRRLNGLETFVFSAAVGLNAVSTYVLAVGLAGAFHWAVFLVPALVVAALAFRLRSELGWHTILGWHVPERSEERGRARERDCHALRCAQGRATRGPKSEETESPSRWLWCLVPFVLIVVLGGMTPPIDFDVREYHSQAPKEFFQQGRITFLPHNVYANMPLGAEMHSLLAMVLSGDWWLGDLAGKLIIALYAPLTALGLYSAGRRWFGPATGAIAAVVYLSTPWILHVSTAGLIDGVLACYVFLAVYACLLSREPAWERQASEPDFSGWHVPERSEGRGGITKNACHALRSAQGRATQEVEDATYTAHRPRGRMSLVMIALSGYLAGAAAATKYPGILFAVVPLTAWIGIWPVTRRVTVHEAGVNTSTKRKRVSASIPTQWQPTRLRFVLVLAVLAGGGLWYAKNAALAGNPTYPLFYEVLGGKTWTPQKDRQWNQVHRPHDFSLARLGHDLGTITLTSEWLSPCLIPLAALALIRGRRRALVLGLVAMLAYGIAAWWLLTHRIDRFWIPLVPLIALLAGVGAGWSTERTWRWGLAALMILGCTSNFLAAATTGPGIDNRWFVSYSRLRDDPLRLDVWHRHFNSHPEAGRPLLVGEADVFDFRVPVLYSTCFDDTLLETLVKNRSPRQIREELAARQITQIYVNWGEVGRYRESGYGFPEFVQPETLDRLVAAGVLEKPYSIENHPGKAYRVVGGKGDRHP